MRGKTVSKAVLLSKQHKISRLVVFVFCIVAALSA